MTKTSRDAPTWIHMLILAVQELQLLSSNTLGNPAMYHHSQNPMILPRMSPLLRQRLHMMIQLLVRRLF